LDTFRRRDWLRLHALRFEGRIVSIVCIFCAHRRAHYYLGGFDNALARYSPGDVLIHFAIQHAIEENVTEFDFLRCAEKYKYRWGAEDRVNIRFVIRQESYASNR